MHAGVKLVIGVLILIAGFYWYLVPSGFAPFGVTTLHALATVFSGLFGLALIFFGGIVAWIEYEDLKWERRERAESQKKAKKKK